MTQTEAQNHYEVLKINPDYEINKNYPYAIRRISTGRVLTPCSSYNQYINVIIGGRTYGLHKVIATQWIENPNNLKEVNHKDNDRTNYHLENLEWISHSDNLKRRSKYERRSFEFVESIPENAVHLDEYKGFRYNKYWFDYDTENLYLKSKNNRVRIIQPSNNRGKPQVTLYDENLKPHSVFWNKFLKVMRERHQA